MSKRSVFQTDLANDAEGRTWRAFGALELYVKEEQGNIVEKVVLYRAPGGLILDITGSIDANIENVGPHQKLNLRKSHSDTDSRHPPQPQVSFAIAVASFDTDKAEFVGSLTQQDATPPRTWPWRGFFLTYRDTPLDVIREGKKPLPPDVMEFLDVSPLKSTGEDEIQTAANSLFSDLIIHGLPEWPVRHLFQGNVGEVGSRFAAENVQGNLPPLLLTAAGNYLNPKTILADDNRLLYLASIHLVVKDLRSADWLVEEYRNECQDKVEPFFNMVGCPTDASLDKLNGLKDTYGSGLTAAQELETLRVQYQDVAKRCYAVAYTCLRSILADSLARPNFLNDVLNVLHSPQYIEHWLPTLVQLPSTQGAVPIVGELAMLSDKLNFLATTEAKSSGSPIDLKLVQDMILLLSAAAQQTGLVRDTIIDPKPERAEVNLVSHVTEATIRTQAFLDAIRNPETHGRSLGMNPNQTENLMTHAWLKQDAKPLGLYTWKWRLGNLFGI